MVEFTDRNGIVKKQTTVYIPKELLELGRQRGINFGATLAEGLQNKLGIVDIPSAR